MKRVVLIVGLIVIFLLAWGIQFSPEWFSGYSVTTWMQGLSSKQLTAAIIGFISAFSSIIFFGVFAWIFLWIFWPMIRNRKILREGMPVRGIILEARPTGVRINRVNYQIKLKLKVIRSDMSPYEVTTKVLSPMMSMCFFRPGVEVKAKVDRQDRMRVAVESDTLQDWNTQALPEEARRKLTEKSGESIF